MPDPHEDDRRITLELRPGREWAEVERARVAVRAWVAASRPNDPQLGEALAMAAAELLENALKYGPSAGAIHLRVTLGGACRPSVEVTQPVGERGEPAALADRVAWIGSRESPEAAYAAAIAEVRSGGSGLGLARVAHEAGCDLAVEVDASACTVRATRRD